MEEIFLSVIIPAHNEGKRIGESLSEMINYLNKQDYSYEILVCEDGSTDNTVEVCKSQENIAQRLIISSNKKGKNQGKGDAVKRGMQLAKGKYLLFADADNATPFWQVEILLKVLEGNDYDIAIGSRYIKGAKLVPPRGAFRTFVSRGGNIIINSFLGLPYKDTRCGFKLFKKEVGKKIFEKVLLSGFGFDDEVLVIARKIGAKVKEVPVEWHEKGESKVALSDVFRSFSEMWQIRKNLKQGKYN